MAAPTQAQLDVLEDAYYSGARTVKHGDKSVTYGSKAEMWQAIQMMRRRINGSTGYGAYFAEPKR